MIWDDLSGLPPFWRPAGFDPLRLGANPETLPYLQEAELMNGRWAMYATAGILFTDAVGLPKWWGPRVPLHVVRPCHSVKEEEEEEEEGRRTLAAAAAFHLV